MSSGIMPASLSAMMGFGLIGAVIAIFVVTPTAARLGRLQVDPRGELPEAFAGLRKRQAIFATIAGVFALLALAAGAMLRG
jgi:Zn-dependent protease